jgi:hypothetical protein
VESGEGRKDARVCAIAKWLDEDAVGIIVVND